PAYGEPETLQFQPPALVLRTGVASLARIPVQQVMAVAAAAGQAVEGRPATGQGGLAQQQALPGLAGEADAGLAAGAIAPEQRQQAGKQCGQHLHGGPPRLVRLDAARRVPGTTCRGTGP